MSNPSSDQRSADALARLKEILLSEDQRRIDALEQVLENLQTRIENKELLIETLEPVIAELMGKKIIGSRHEMAEALSPIMSEAIKNQIEYAKDEVVDALYPVIGRTIRRSIAEAMRNLVRTVNERVERAVSPRLILQRLKARLSGVSQGDLILKESMPFQVHEVFLIHKETGLLLVHSSDHTSQSGADQDLISGMLTAIKDFAQTLFSGSESRDLHEIQYEDRQIRLEVGQFAYLACITSGIPTDDFSAKVAQLLHGLHRKYLPALRDFSGDTVLFQPAQTQLGRFIQFFRRSPDQGVGETDGQSKRFRFGFVFLFGLLIVLLGIYLGIFFIPNKATGRKVKQALLELENENPALSKAGIGFKVRRKSVILSGRVLQLGDKESVAARLGAIPSIRDVINGIEVLPWAEDPERLYEEIRGRQDGYFLDLSRIKFIIEDDILYIKGTVISEEQKKRIVEAIAEYTSLPVIVENIRLDSEVEWQRIKKSVEGTVLYFSTGQSELEGGELDKLAEILRILETTDFGQLLIIGHADDTGASEVNLWLSQQRAEWVKNYLVESGVLENKLIVSARGSEEPVALDRTAQARALNRRVEFIFDVEEKVPR